MPRQPLDIQRDLKDCSIRFECENFEATKRTIIASAVRRFQRLPYKWIWQGKLCWLCHWLCQDFSQMAKWSKEHSVVTVPWVTEVKNEKSSETREVLRSLNAATKAETTTTRSDGHTTQSVGTVGTALLSLIWHFHSNLGQKRTSQSVWMSISARSWLNLRNPDHIQRKKGFQRDFHQVWKPHC